MELKGLDRISICSLIIALSSAVIGGGLMIGGTVIAVTSGWHGMPLELMIPGGLIFFTGIGTGSTIFGRAFYRNTKIDAYLNQTAKINNILANQNL